MTAGTSWPWRSAARGAQEGDHGQSHATAPARLDRADDRVDRLEEADDQTSIATGDSVQYLAGLAADFAAGGRTADLVYLDAHDVDWHYWFPSAAHHLMELCAVLRILRKDTLVVVDDCGISGHFVRPNANTINFVSAPVIGGKGRLVAEFAARVGAKVEFSDYQAAWSGF